MATCLHLGAFILLALSAASLSEAAPASGPEGVEMDCTVVIVEGRIEQRCHESGQSELFQLLPVMYSTSSLQETQWSKVNVARLNTHSSETSADRLAALMTELIAQNNGNGGKGLE